MPSISPNLKSNLKSQVCFLTPSPLCPEKPLFVFLPGMDGTGQLLRTQIPDLETVFDIRCLAIPPDDLSTWDELSAKVALRQLDGYASKNYDSLESELTWCLAHIEASIDFSTEGLDVIDPKTLIDKLLDIKSQIDQLILTYKSGKLIKDGIKLVLLGKPNVGKSSLLNVLVQDEKAIVTELAGTTRDVIEAQTLFSGIRFQISDTAGLRETKDQIELIGVDRSKKEALKADVLCVVLAVNEEEDWSETLTLANSVKASKNL